jgi:hypothetical protein
MAISRLPVALRCCAALVWSALSLSAGSPAWAGSGDGVEIGTAISIKPTVTALLGSDKRSLREGGRVHRSEYLETGPDARAELKLDDETKLALGPNAALRLDEFVVGPAAGGKSVGLNFVKGTFRFITGTQKSDSYSLETPSATIGVRGTVFDIYVDGNGDTLVLLHEGKVEICSRSRTCRQHDAIGRLVHASVAGVLSAPMKFTKGIIPGLTAGKAFPFLGRSLQIDPIRRLTPSGIMEGPATIERTFRKVVPF